MTPLVSVVILTRNGMATLPAVIDAIWRQRTSFAIETIAVDSASTDGTTDFLRGRLDRLIEIPAAAFNHGTTRNLGVEAARGDLVVLLVQDAEPASDDWLMRLTAPLRADASLAGTFARQRPRDDASAMVRYYLERSSAASATPRTMALASRAEFDALDPMARLERCAFDDVCACIRRSVWEQHRFPATPIGEDVEWARDVLLAGGRLAYVPDAVVIHSHDRPAREEFTRTRALHARLNALFGLRTIPTLRDLARSIASSLILHWRRERAAPRDMKRPSGMGRSLALAVAWPLGQYLGQKSKT